MYIWLIYALYLDAIVSSRCTCFLWTTHITTIGCILSKYQKSAWTSL